MSTYDVEVFQNPKKILLACVCGPMTIQNIYHIKIVQKSIITDVTSILFVYASLPVEQLNQ